MALSSSTSFYFLSFLPPAVFLWTEPARKLLLIRSFTYQHTGATGHHHLTVIISCWHLAHCMFIVAHRFLSNGDDCYCCRHCPNTLTRLKSASHLRSSPLIAPFHHCPQFVVSTDIEWRAPSGNWNDQFVADHQHNWMMGDRCLTVCLSVCGGSRWKNGSKRWRGKRTFNDVKDQHTMRMTLKICLCAVCFDFIPHPHHQFFQRCSPADHREWLKSWVEL